MIDSRSQISLNHYLSSRDKLILAGLFLSKFDFNGLHMLGFSGFTEAFNAIALGLNANPASLKNYRDEFDPFFPNSRQGWHKRPIRKHCKIIMDEFNDLNIFDFSQLLRSEISYIGDIDIIQDGIELSEENSFAKRLMTGQAAEKYFEVNYKNLQEFKGLSLVNTTGFGCGFDYKLFSDKLPFIAVEVKGINFDNGTILLTNKEYKVAKYLNDRFYLFVVRNFAEKPYHTIIKNPLQSNLVFNFQETATVNISWLAKIDG